MNKKGKPGKTTTEFWGIKFTQLATVISGLAGFTSPDAVVIIVAVLEGLYAAGRSYVKGKETQK